MISLYTSRLSYSYPRHLVLRPELRQPLVRVRRRVHVRSCPVELSDCVASQVVQRVFLIWPGSNSVRDSLDIVANLLVDHALDVLNLGVLDAVLVTIVGVDYAHAGAVDGNDVLDGHVALGLVEAVAAGLVEGAKGFGVETGDVELASETVVLEDLVLSVASSATDDSELGVEALGGQRVFADVFPPDWSKC